jgi:hypothetical protein
MDSRQSGNAIVSRTGRLLGLLLAVAMFLFSCWVYLASGDWVAALFALGSVAYGLFFYTTTAGRNR